MIALALITSLHLRLTRTCFLRLACLAACLLLLTTSASAQNLNPIQRENALRDTITNQWYLAKPAMNREIEGYASATSINRNGVINLFVNSSEPYTIEFFRMGCYGTTGNCLGARRMPVGGSTNPIPRNAQPQITPTPDPTTGLTECNWVNPYTLDLSGTSSVPGEVNHWTSGFYLARLTITAPTKPSLDGKQSYIIFVVRNDQYNSTYLFQSSVTTFQAYNNWGGKSLYDYSSTGGQQAVKVSFNRPYASSGSSDTDSAGQFFAWEYNMVRWLEGEGYDVAYWTNVDTHARGASLTNHKVFLSVGHDEYWSWEMRDNVELARDSVSSPVNLAFFAANTCYWQIRFEPSSLQTGLVPDRTIVCYKVIETFIVDPDPRPERETTRWRLNPVKPPEDALLGVRYEIHNLVRNGNVILERSCIETHWVCAGLVFPNDQVLPGLLGYEVDRRFESTPPNTVTLATSTYWHIPTSSFRYSHMTVYPASSGAMVFATGTIQWSWGLDNYGKTIAVVPAARRITENVLVRFGL